MIELRSYQREAIQSLYDYFEVKIGNPLVVLPTGTGKSVVIAAFVREAVESFPDTRVLMVTHVKELIAQNYAALVRLWPEAPAGIYSAGLNKRDLDARILFCGIQSVHNKAVKIQQCDLVLVDEAHLIPRTSSTMYRRFLKELTEINPHLKVIGFTATPYRLDSGMLHKGREALFDAIAYDANVRDMIEQGYLCRITTKATEQELDVTGVHRRGGDFIQAELEDAIDDVETNRALVAEVIRKAGNRGSWLFFCAGKQHAGHLAEELATQGIDVREVYGDTPAIERDRILSDFKAGRIRALCNVNVLTTGFDAPGVDLIAMCRPTESVGLYVQMCGRGTRLAEGKDNCLILDFAGNAKRHGPIDLIDGSGFHDAKATDDLQQKAPVKTCPECDEIVHAAVRRCPACGHEFPPPKPAVAPQIIKAAVISTEIEPEWIEVKDARFNLHVKPDAPPSMRVSYLCGLVVYNEWVCFEHKGFPREKASAWWRRRAPGAPVPATTAEALERAGELPRPTHICVRQAGRYFDITGARF